MPRAGTKPMTGGKHADYYEISVRQFAQQILPAGPAGDDGLGLRRGRRRGSQERAAASTTRRRSPSRRSATGRSGSSGSTSSWTRTATTCRTCCRSTRRCTGRTRRAATTGRDTRPAFDETPGPVHGPGARSSPTSTARWASATRATATPEAWYLPAAEQHPGRLRHRGHLVRLLRGQGGGQLRGALGARATRSFQYPNANRASTHLVPRPHAGHDPAQRLCRSRRASTSSAAARGDDAVLDSRTGDRGRPARPGARAKATSSRPTRPTTRSRSPSRTARSTPTGRCSTRTPARSSTASPGPYIPDDRPVSPIWNPEFFGNTIMVNGNTWPFQTVEQRRYRFRFLNGCQSRFLILDFSDDPRRRGLADRQRGRLPRRAGQPHGATTATGC